VTRLALRIEWRVDFHAAAKAVYDCDLRSLSIFNFVLTRYEKRYEKNRKRPREPFRLLRGRDSIQMKIKTVSFLSFAV
jgi:hypothetical protein